MTPAAFGSISFGATAAGRLRDAVDLFSAKEALAIAFQAVSELKGGIAGWMLGYFAYDGLAKPVLEFYGKLESFESLRASVSFEMILLLLITSGLAHLPPIKVVTILSGVAGVNLGLFVISAILARGARFFFLAWLLRRYGAPIQEFIEKRLGLIAGAGAAALILLYLLFRWLY